MLPIGIDHFAAPSLTLHSAVADARSFAALATQAGTPVFTAVHTTLLTDGQATRAGILAAFATLAAQVRPDDTFLFYVASHGARRQGDGRFLLVPADESDLSAWSALARQAIDETTLVGAPSRIRARDALLFIDTCYSGAVTAEALANVGHETGRYLPAASSSVQEALDTYDGRKGLLIYALQVGLDGARRTGRSGRAGAAQGAHAGRGVQDSAGGPPLLPGGEGDRRREGRPMRGAGTARLGQPGGRDDAAAARSAGGPPRLRR